MSLIACPNCKRKISNRAVICDRCGFADGEVSEADLEVYRARKLRDRIYRLNMISYAVITVFLAAFGWYWWDSGGFARQSSAGPFILMGLATVAYLSVRVLLFRNRQRQKVLRKKEFMRSKLRRKS